MTWTLKWETHFPVDVALGGFAATGNDITCPRLPASVRAEWGAYPAGWPDTATQRSYPVGGYYDPAACAWISGGQLHIRLWRGASGGVHSCALVPLAAQGMTYGRYAETFTVSRVTAGYKSAHLLWPAGGNQDTVSYEVDYPENEWDTPISAYIHGGAELSFDTGANWGTQHTTEIRWTPDSLTFIMDGKVTGTTAEGVPPAGMDWIIQNESALNGESAALNSEAQMDISYAGVYAYSAAPAPVTQQGWRWCRKCQGLFYGPGQAESHCPDGDQHDSTGSGNYILTDIP